MSGPADSIDIENRLSDEEEVKNTSNPIENENGSCYIASIPISHPIIHKHKLTILKEMLGNTTLL